MKRKTNRNEYFFSFEKQMFFFVLYELHLKFDHFTSKVFGFFAQDTVHSCLQWPCICAVFSSSLIQSSPLRSTRFCSHVLSSYVFTIHLRKSA